MSIILSTPTLSRAFTRVTAVAQVTGNDIDEVGFLYGKRKDDLRFQIVSSASGVGYPEEYALSESLELPSGRWYFAAYAESDDETFVGEASLIEVFNLTADVASSGVNVEQVIKAQQAAGYTYIGSSPSSTSGQVVLHFEKTYEQLTATIESGQPSTAAIVFTPGYKPVKFIFSGTYTNTSFAVQELIDGVWVPFRDDIAAQVSVPVSTGSVNLTPMTVANLLNPIRLLGVSNEAALRTIKVQARRY